MRAPLLLLAISVSAAFAQTPTPKQEIDNVAAFARLYGVVRYFYPTDAGMALLPHLLDSAETDRWMHIARIAGPFGQVADWTSVGWDMKPAEPRVTTNRVFLTDGRAISYAESVMGYVGDRKLGTIIGGATAGANGNVANFAVPGGFQIAFTGMRVTRHDGRTPFHVDGVRPDIPLEPTLVGLRAGRDELLERAMAVLRGSVP